MAQTDSAVIYWEWKRELCNRVHLFPQQDFRFCDGRDAGPQTLFNRLVVHASESSKWVPPWVKFLKNSSWETETIFMKTMLKFS